MSPYFQKKWAAEVEYDQMGKSMCEYVLLGKAWIYRKQIHLLSKEEALRQPEGRASSQKKNDQLSKEEPALKRKKDQLSKEEQPEEEPTLKRIRTPFPAFWDLDSITETDQNETKKNMCHVHDAWLIPNWV